jgi:hypothetical protein
MEIQSPADMSLFALRRRWKEAVREQPTDLLRIHLLASYTIDPLVPYAGLQLDDAGLPARLTTGPANQIVQQLLDEAGDVRRLRPDVLVVAARFEELDGEYDELLRVADVSVATAVVTGSCLVFVLPAIPERRPSGVGDIASPQGAVARATLVREELRRRLAGRPDVLLADAEEALRAVGSRHAHHPALFRFAKVPYTEAAFASLGSQVGRILRCRFGLGARMAVLDLDSMLPADGPQHVLEPLLRELRGADIALAARGSADDATWQALAGHPELLCDLLGACALDDRPVSEQLERLAAGAAVPVSETLLLTCDRDLAGGHDGRGLVLAEDPDRWAIALYDAGLLDRPADALDDDRPTGLADAVPAPAGALSLADFVASLDVAVRFAPVDETDLPAVTELVERAKDFTLGIHHGAAELAARRDELVGVAVSDRFGDHGLSAAFAMRIDGATCTVDLFSMSCAVMSRGVEDAVLRELVERAAAAGCDTIAVRHAHTEHNDVAVRFVGAAAEQAWPVAIRAELGEDRAA